VPRVRLCKLPLSSLKLRPELVHPGLPLVGLGLGALRVRPRPSLGECRLLPLLLSLRGRLQARRRLRRYPRRHLLQTLSFLLGLRLLSLQLQLQLLLFGRFKHHRRFVLGLGLGRHSFVASAGART
jgi:hypothetical protein